ncbi:VWA domain-containing protein [Lutimaribacter saemankumensis]|nr:VWA domain-containing protein [Lutimaribacter saemankumensis]
MGLGSAEKRRSTRDAMQFIWRFSRDESGIITAQNILMVMMFLMLGGLGVDMMRHEMVRTQLQSTLDRAVLAAADLDQTLEPEAVVADYFAKSGMGDYLSSVQTSEGLGFRNVYAEAEIELKTTLMHLAGIKTLTAPAAGAAEERIPNVEISMVLDVSGSMGPAGSSKMESMKNAAKTFVRTVLGDSYGERGDDVSISLIPYSEHVNIGKDLFELLDTKKHHKHGFSYCVEIPDGHMEQTWLNQGHQFEQVQHYQWNYHGDRFDTSNTVCPRDSWAEVTTFSRDPEQLINQIDQFTGRAGTSIFLGMKWGVALLDPDSNNLVKGMIAKAQADSAFAARPASFEDENTLKIVILMTDGENQSSYRIAPWYYKNESHYVHWNNNNFWGYLYTKVKKHYNNWYLKYYEPATGDRLTADTCNIANERGIQVYTIAFEVSGHGADVMRDCASSPSHFIEANGDTIEDDFKSIGLQINKLRLTQ